MHVVSFPPQAPTKLFYHPSMGDLAHRIGEECEKYVRRRFDILEGVG
jgi:hypothetical protein